MCASSIPGGKPAHENARAHEVAEPGRALRAPSLRFAIPGAPDRSSSEERGWEPALRWIDEEDSLDGGRPAGPTVEALGLLAALPRHPEP